MYDVYFALALSETSFLFWKVKLSIVSLCAIFPLSTCGVLIFRHCRQYQVSTIPGPYDGPIGVAYCVLYHKKSGG